MITQLEIYNSQSLETKLKKIESMFQDKSVLVAFSGGVDSSVVAYLAKKYALKTKLVMQTGVSVGIGEVEFAKRQAKQIGLDLQFIEYDEVDYSREYVKNPDNRCYYCKQLLHKFLENMRLDLEYDFVASGTNISDLEGHRPGQKAQIEAGVINPLVYAKITKQEVRWIANQAELISKNKPSMACLASRFITNVPITKKGLKRIAAAEYYLKNKFNLQIVRVRDHGDFARIEIGINELNKVLKIDIFEKIEQELTKLGFKFVSLDMKGYRPANPN